MISVRVYNDGFVKDLVISFITFPAGERHISIKEGVTSRYALSGPTPPFITIEYQFTGSDSVFDLLLTVDSLRREYQPYKFSLLIKYFPYSRQDRVCNLREAFSLKVFVDVLKTCNFDRIITWDAHSDVLAGMFPAGAFYNLPQEALASDAIDSQIGDLKNLILVSPDGGALKKIYKTAKLFPGCQVLRADKNRDTQTGEILNTFLVNKEVLNNVTSETNLVIIDDICDGGRTFIELAKVINPYWSTGNLYLYVTHGIFSKGFSELSDYFDGIFCPNVLNQQEAGKFVHSFYNFDKE